MPIEPEDKRRMLSRGISCYVCDGVAEHWDDDWDDGPLCDACYVKEAVTFEVAEAIRLAVEPLEHRIRMLESVVDKLVGGKS